MRTDVGALVALDTVVLVPQGHEGLHAALLVGGSAHLPRTVDSAVLDECADGQQVAGLGVDGSHELLDECGSVVHLLLVVGQVGPLGLHGQLHVLATAVDGGVVLVHHVLTLGAVALQGGSLHLLHGELHGDDAGDAEECRLQDGVGAVAQANLLCNLRSVDGVNGDVVLSEVALNI